jgi:hypothetical protein
MTTLKFESSIVGNIRIGDYSVYVETINDPNDIDCFITFYADINSTFKNVPMPYAKTNSSLSTSQDYYDFPVNSGDILRSYFLQNLSPQKQWDQRPNCQGLSTHQGTYIQQVKQQLLRLFSHMRVTVHTGTFDTGSGLVRLKDSACLSFVLDAENPNTLARNTFTGEQLVQLCEASSRDAARYTVSVDETHRLKLKENDSWCVKVKVSAKGADSSVYSNTQTWALTIVQRTET